MPPFPQAQALHGQPNAPPQGPLWTPAPPRRPPLATKPGPAPSMSLPLRPPNVPSPPRWVPYGGGVSRPPPSSTIRTGGRGIDQSGLPGSATGRVCPPSLTVRAAAGPCSTRESAASSILRMERGRGRNAQRPPVSSSLLQRRPGPAATTSAAPRPLVGPTGI